MGCVFDVVIERITARDAGTLPEGMPLTPSADEVDRIKITALLVRGDERLDAESWRTLRTGDGVEVVEKGE